MNENKHLPLEKFPESFVEHACSEEADGPISARGPAITKKIIIELGMADYDPILSVKCQPCNFPLEEEAKKCIADLTELMLDKGTECLGIAAPQIGVPRQIFTIWDRSENVKVIINPVLLHRSAEKSKHIEGCLSIPKFGCWVQRYKTITIKYQDLEGKEYTERFDFLPARVIQHEMDHLDGRLLTYHYGLFLEKEANRLLSIKDRRKKIKEKRRK